MKEKRKTMYELRSDSKGTHLNSAVDAASAFPHSSSVFLRTTADRGRSKYQREGDMEHWERSFWLASDAHESLRARLVLRPCTDTIL